MNTRRKARKAYNLAQYYFYQKANYSKAVLHYLRAIRIGSRFADDEHVLHQVAQCYYHLWEHEKALSAVDLGLRYSGGSIELLEDKRDILEALGRVKQAKECAFELEKVTEKLKNQTLNLDDFYQS